MGGVGCFFFNPQGKYIPLTSIDPITGDETPRSYNKTVNYIYILEKKWKWFHANTL